MADEADKDAKIVLDPIYGTIHLDFLAVKIIDTPYFQRLRYIKQLSFVDFVYPGATHTRFAHSIGVYHLACQMIKKIETGDLPEGAAKMSTDDKRCIRVAALCHDLGHGPFSHLYEQIGETILGEDIGRKLKHAKISQVLVEKMFHDYDLKKYLGAKPDQQILLIQDLIEGKRALTETEKKKKYMFQIVSNKDSGMDVDKWDYFNRDATACGVSERFQYDRALSVARVVETKADTFELGYIDYDAFCMYSMFNTRFSLQKKVYMHKTVQAVDLLITDVCNLVCTANRDPKNAQRNKIDIYPITSQKKETGPYRYMELDPSHYLDLDKYLTLRDDVLLEIRYSSEKMYKGARDLLQRLHERKLYKLVGDICVPVPQCECANERAEDVIECKCAKERAEEIKKCIEEHLRSETQGIFNEVEVKLVGFDYGLKQKDPVQELYFYNKMSSTRGKKRKRNEISPVLPNVFQEYHVRVYDKFSRKENDSTVQKNNATIKRIMEEVRNSFTNQMPPKKKQKVDDSSSSLNE